MTESHYALLQAFRGLFENKPYRHRNPSLGDYVASQLYEDLVRLGKSEKLLERVRNHDRVVNLRNIAIGKPARRGDGTFGEIVPAAIAVVQHGMLVARGSVATIEIGAETKILAKAMIKQIDRVIGDLSRQVDQFRRTGGDPICVGFVGVNHAEQYTSYEKRRRYKTDGKKEKHPFQEASRAEALLIQKALPSFDEFQLLRFRATNIKPYPFEWVDLDNTIMEYGSLLTRISREYDRRF